jgi:hypothetical protein
MRAHYTVATIVACSGWPGCAHRKTAETVRVGYANDTLLVSCECGGQYRALTYAKPKRDRR